MVIPGYGSGFPSSVDVDRLLWDGWELTDRAEFWAAHYLNQSIEEEDVASRVWGVEGQAVREMQDLLSNKNSWPVFKINVKDGARLIVVYRNFEDDPGVDYLITPDRHSDCIRIATLEGHYEGPGISWSEALSVSRLMPSPIEQAKTLLLLGPMLGDVEADTEAGINIFVEALRATGATGDAEEFARLIVAENPQWEPAIWRTLREGVLVCDSESSPRNPAGMNPLPSRQLKIISDFLSIH